MATAAPLSLWEAFADVPDPRDASGLRYPLPAILTLTATAMLAGARSLYAIAQFGRDHGHDFARQMGFNRKTCPCVTTLHYLFRRLDVTAFETAIQNWSYAMAADWPVVSIDGKRLRGTQGHQLPGVHLLAIYGHHAQTVLAQQSVGTTNEHKAALQALRLIPIENTIVLGDAMFCQRDLSVEVSQRHGDWVWSVRDNQPELHSQIQHAFEDRTIFPPAVAAG